MRYQCIDGRAMRHDPQPDDPYLQTDIGACEVCDGEGCKNPLSPQHTPTPWQFAPLTTRGVDTTDGLGYIRPLDEDGLEIAHHGDTGRSGEENRANAALIIRACNLLSAGLALEGSQDAAIRARGGLPPDRSYGLTENEVSTCLMMNALLQENGRFRKALEDICKAAPTEEPEFVGGTGNEDDARNQGSDTTHWFYAQIARAALVETTGGSDG